MPRWCGSGLGREHQQPSFSMPKMAAQPSLLAGCPCIVQMWRAVMLATNWQELYEDAIFEINPDKLTSCIEEAEQAIAQRESFVDITQAERHRLADARSVLKSLNRNCFVARETLPHVRRPSPDNKNG